MIWTLGASTRWLFAGLAVAFEGKGRAPRGIAVILFHPGWVSTDTGGAEAPVTPEDSAAGIRAVTARATPADNGRFFNYDGEELPW